MKALILGTVSLFFGLFLFSIVAVITRFYLRQITNGRFPKSQSSVTHGMITDATTGLVRPTKRIVHRGDYT